MADAPVSPANVADFRFAIRGVDAELRVTAFAGTEGVSQLYQHRIRLCSEDGGIDPEQVLGLPATLEIDGEQGTRVIHGIVRSFARVGDGIRLTHYELLLVPPHWLLTRRVQSRVFNEKRCKPMDVIGVVSKVLADAGLTADDLKLAIDGQYEPREMIVQYRESDWDFVSRLLEEEGVYYFFEQHAERCKLVLMDAKGLHAPFVATGSDVPFRKESGMVAEHESVYSAQLTGEMHVGAVSLDDYTFRQPANELKLSAAGARFTSLTVADYPGGYADTGRGKRLVDARLLEKQCEARQLTLGATVRALWPGSRFKLIEHPDERFNIEYLVLSQTIRGTQTQSGDEEAGGDVGCRFEADIRAIPAAVQFRPPRCTPRPTVLGSQTAMVVGPPGEEIHTDEYGRVEVKFHWDQEGAHDVGASCWIRVSQAWAGGQYGAVFLPRIGQEVIVDFLEGNPDQPIITGRVYNRDQMPPYKLPENKTISAIRTCSSPGAGGGNEIRFDDKKGGEQLLLFAQNALHVRAQGNRYETVCGDAHETVAGDVDSLIRKGKREVVKLDCEQYIHGGRTLYVKADSREDCQGSKWTTVQNDFWISVETGEIHIRSDKSLTLQSSGNFIKLDPSGITILGKMVNINSGGSIGNSNSISFMLDETEPYQADGTKFGHNVRYNAAEAASSAAGGSSSDETREPTWIEIELIDEAGMPCPDEAYEIILPDGKKIGGTLDKDGRAHVAVKDPGSCQITFPRLDAAAWEPVG